MSVRFQVDLIPLIDHLINLGIIGVLSGPLYFLIVNPYIRYYKFRDDLAKEGMKISGTILNSNLPEFDYKVAYDEINNWLGEMNVLKNRLKFNNWLKRFKIPSKKDIDEAIKCAAFIRNTLSQQEYIVDVYHNYNRLMEIFNINQDT